MDPATIWVQRKSPASPMSLDATTCTHCNRPEAPTPVAPGVQI
ncbi:hypothetical protein SNOG_09959 [Parastagonospora nodorum SN15]|uniref:Uncharacterized protein n=1 Tax=Phaeosphaeria nodorum (strain SN15 / ATCC MYA-4574 / FGSC 10173) TaxID=321614 RepID=Q0UE55_PHANO|nr:hypothetical protein SNOG_09959 [Parastagonospora nodorum SN15]EAT82294.1 hypothetical protein SNOG_09959 [Parastagonospora nodorum SN15]